MLSGDQYRLILEGAWVTLRVSFLAFALGTAIGLVGGIASSASNRVLRWFVRIYVELFRGVSAIILLFWMFFALPPLAGISLSPMTAGVLALGTNMGAYATELARGGLAAVPKGQTEAAIAINLTGFQRLRHVILPQAVITMLPPYGNLLIEVLKASALVSLITLNDIVFEAQKLRNNRAADSVDIWGFVLVLYFVIALAITGLVRAAELYFSRGMDIGRRAPRGA